MSILFELFYTFLKVGLFSFGGGYGMLSVIQGEVVTRHAWLTSAEFTDIVAISQMTPGPIGINSATYVGYTAAMNATGSPAVAVAGSLLASLAVMLPSFVIMLTISRYFMKYSKSNSVEAVFRALRPAVVGLIASAALLLMTVENFGSPTESTMQFVVSVLLFIGAFVATYRFKVSPIVIVIVCGAIGGLFYGLAGGCWWFAGGN
ncbi:MAG: chromate transporter [Bacteroidaceae bacterium]|nr:chromate transporter [Bacteroidaceae bacterium]